MTALDLVASLERALIVWRTWALEPAELGALTWAEQDVELLRTALTEQGPAVVDGGLVVQPSGGQDREEVRARPCSVNADMRRPW